MNATQSEQSSHKQPRHQANTYTTQQTKRRRFPWCFLPSKSLGSNANRSRERRRVCPGYLASLLIISLIALSIAESSLSLSLPLPLPFSPLLFPLIPILSSSRPISSPLISSYPMISSLPSHPLPSSPPIPSLYPPRTHPILPPSPSPSPSPPLKPFPSPPILPPSLHRKIHIIQSPYTLSPFQLLERDEYWPVILDGNENGNRNRYRTAASATLNSCGIIVYKYTT